MRARHLALCLVAGCGAKAAAPSAGSSTAPPRGSSSLDDYECEDDCGGSEWIDGVAPDAPDCFEGPGANIFEARYEQRREDWEGNQLGPGLSVNACQWDAVGPAQVITVDGGYSLLA